MQELPLTALPQANYRTYLCFSILGLVNCLIGLL